MGEFSQQDGKITLSVQYWMLLYAIKKEEVAECKINKTESHTEWGSYTHSTPADHSLWV